MQAESPPAPKLPLQLEGLGGWLIFVQLGLYFTLVLIAFQLAIYTVPLMGSETWSEFANPSSELYDPLIRPLLFGELVFNTVNLVLAVLCLIKMYQKKAAFPRLMILFYLINLLAGMVEYAMIAQIPLLQEDNDLRGLVRQILMTAIWVPYFLRSVRVRNTFVKG